MFFKSNFNLFLIVALISLAPISSYSQDAVAQGEALLKSAIKAHGGSAYETAHYEFIFRGKNYTFHNQNERYTYTRAVTKDGQTILDKMNNEGFVRTTNGIETALTEKELNGNKEALNSVLYFAMLPYKLNDKAVNASYAGEQVINDQTYSLVQVTFDQEGGGKDYDDTFMYWINQISKTMDYLAYSYHVNGGGVRFRTAYNTRKVKGILFQDYVNYKADKATSLERLPALWQANELKELSKIVTEEVKPLKRKK